jgi:ABC-type sugar transport system ATPase subunit
MSDRILVMSNGTQTKILPIEDADQYSVMKYAVQYSHVVSTAEA